MEEKIVVYDGKTSFKRDTSITGFTLADGVTEIGRLAFKGCTGLTSLAGLPTGVTKIGGSAFEGCTGLTSLEGLPMGVTEIGTEAFSGCTGLTTLEGLRST